MKRAKEVRPTNICNLCEGVANNLVMFNKGMPIERARAKAAAEFYELHDENDCIEELVCLPILRLRNGGRT